MKRKTWKDKLTKAERDHLKEVNIRTFMQMVDSIALQDSMRFPCWTCISIGRKLGMKATTTIFHAEAGNA